jgi:phosphopentomutase/2,3-bisphosphoglycerate-independent phosphoglycerate mutase family metalloenzyme
MKYLLITSVFLAKLCFSQPQQCENIFIITTDGLRWQEIFNGADSAILFNSNYVKDGSAASYLYWNTDPKQRRKMLMPFLWNYVAVKGQLLGNRNYENYVSVANPYSFSYPGYNELLTGYADRSIMKNRAKNNHNSNLLGYLSTLPKYKNSVAFFGSWKLFSYIVNGTKNKIPLNCGYDEAAGDSLSVAETAVNYLQQENNVQPTRNDMLTFTLASEYIKRKHPRIAYIGFGETDEFAHRGEYDNYLEQINQFDKFLARLWALVQEDEFYKNKTTLFITTDHGRGKNRASGLPMGPSLPDLMKPGWCN